MNEATTPQLAYVVVITWADHAEVEGPMTNYAARKRAKELETRFIEDAGGNKPRRRRALVCKMQAPR